MDRFNSKEEVDSFDDLAYRNGAMARWDGNGLSANPYLPSAPRHRIWAAGWADADQIILSEESAK